VESKKDKRKGESAQLRAFSPQGVTMTPDSQPKTSPFKTGHYLAMSLLASLGLIITTSAFWFNQYIFNNENFTTLATQAVTSDSSRQALATEITDRLLQNRPLLQNRASDLSVKVISGVLDSSLAQGLTQRSISRLQVAMTSEYPESIQLDLVPIKDIINTVASAAARFSGSTESESSFDQASVPDQIVLLEANSVPNIYQMGLTLTWLGPLALVVAIILLAIPIFQTRKNKNSLMKALGLEGTVVLGGGILCLLLGPLFKPPVLAQVQNENIRIIESNLYDAFVSKFNQGSVFIFVIGVVLLLAAGGVKYYFRNR
jgi:hypothetical protein